MRDRIPREHALLLCCARTQRPPAQQAHLQRLVADGLDWDDLVRLGTRHGILSLLYWHIKALPPALIGRAVPADTLNHLREYFHGNSMRYFALSAELLRILDLFEDHGVLALPFKGVALATYVYGNPALRQPGDLDVLVRPEDASTAMVLLMQLDYQPRSPARMTRSQRQALARFSWAVHFYHEKTQVEVDLQWRLVSPVLETSTNFAGLWQRRDVVSIRGGTVRVVGAADSLGYLCLHGSKHGWICLKWVCDVAELLRVSPDLDWACVARRTQTRQTTLWLGLALAHELLETPLPAYVHAHIDRTATFQRLVEAIRDQLLNRPVASDSPVVEGWAEVVALGPVGLSLRGHSMRLALQLRDRCPPSVGHREKLAPACGHPHHPGHPPRVIAGMAVPALSSAACGVGATKSVRGREAGGVALVGSARSATSIESSSDRYTFAVDPCGAHRHPCQKPHRCQPQIKVSGIGSRNSRRGCRRDSKYSTRRWGHRRSRSTFTPFLAISVEQGIERISQPPHPPHPILIPLPLLLPLPLPSFSPTAGQATSQVLILAGVTAPNSSRPNRAILPAEVTT